MDSPTSKRLKMSHTQTSSNTTETGEINTNYSYYDGHYNQPFYVDKTLLIKELLKSGHVLISAPPRFGKTLNMDMAKRFLEIEVDEDGKAIELDVDEDERCLKEVQTRSKNFKLFQGKKILREKKFVFEHFGKYPIIHVDFSELVGHDFEEILVKFRKIINKAFRQHAYLEKSSLWDREEYNKEDFMNFFDPVKCASLNKFDVEEGLEILARFLHGHHGKAVFMFIDDLDEPVHTMIYQNMMSTEDKEDTIELLQDITRYLLKGNEFIGRSLSNSCLIFSTLILQKANNILYSPFMDDRMFPKFYGFEEAEVKYLLEKAGRIEDFNEIKEKYNGYKTTLRDGSHIELYNSWAIMNYLKTGNFDVYWPASILDKIKQTIGHDEIRSEFIRIMSNQLNRVEYCDMPDISHIESLSKILCKNEVAKHNDTDFFMQFLSDQGFFLSTHSYYKNISLKIPNRTVYSVIDKILGSIDAMKKYYNHSTELIDKLTDSFENLARLRNEEAVHVLTESIVALSGSKRTLNTKYELQSVLDAYMSQKFQHVVTKCRTSLHAKCDTVLVIADLHVMFIIEYKSVGPTNDLDDAQQHISDRGYDTLAEEASLKEIFPEDTPTVQNRIYLKIQLDRGSKISITYSFNNMEPNTVSKCELN
ncbi:hypothetical protein PV328_001339 [Microctonus aethiopoides]|uniref:AAA-ATPase-like domain-containing protein n=1 Tax=Microctonus aethiopoides TaxID=144406 RepID=A0AA39KXG3_9HYME|nr:hypothetical protein PV328_001339 [Microctonus aethiopoides]